MATDGSLYLTYRVLPTNTDGAVKVTYQVLPVDAADFASTGSVNQHSSLPSAGKIPIHGVLRVRYEVRERPKVTVGFNPVADAFVLDYEPVLNYGDLANLVIGRYDSKTARALLRFDISSLQTDLVIVEARLVLVGRIVSGTGQVEVHEVIDSWDELGVTWYNQPGRSPLAEDAQPIADVIDLDVTRLFKGWYAGTRANNGVAVVSANELVEAHVVVPSREWPAGLLRPQLLVTYYAPEGTPQASELLSQGSVIGRTQSDLSSSGAVAGDWNDLTSKGAISRLHVFSIGTVRVTANLPSTGTIRGTTTAFDFDGLGAVSRKDLPSQGRPRLADKNDFAGAGYVLEHNDLPGAGYVSGAANELASAGLVMQRNDLPSQGGVWLPASVDLETAGYVAGAPNELPSRGHVTGQWMRSSGTVRQIADLYSRGWVRTTLDLPSTGKVYYRAASDLPASGLPSIRDAEDLMSIGLVRSFYSDLPCKGHVDAWIFEIKVIIGTRPPQGRSTREV